MAEIAIPLQNQMSTQFGDNILFGLLQLGLPLDVALPLALKHQQKTQQFPKLADPTGSLMTPYPDEEEEGLGGG